MNPRWLLWARELQAIGQTGLAYGRDQYDRERYQRLQEIAAEMMVQGAGLAEGAAPIAKLFKQGTGYATPKVDVRAAVFREGQILLVRETEDGGWSLPGGWADVGDSPSVAAVREVREESGYEVRATKLAAVYDRDRHGHPPIPFHTYKLFFLCDFVRGEPARSYETDGVEFFAEDTLPTLSLTRVTPEEIGHMFDHYRHPEWPTSFD